MRTWDQRIILDVFSNNMIAVSLSGYLFFGSAIAVSDKLIAVRTAAEQKSLQNEPSGYRVRVTVQHLMNSSCPAMSCLALPPCH